MLVLSRKSNEEISFPTLGITIRILRTKSNGVKVGIVAPKGIRVLRGELVELTDLIDAFHAMTPKVDSHEVRNRLNAVVLNLELLNRIQHDENAMKAMGVIDSVTQSLDQLESMLNQTVIAAPAAMTAKRQKRLLVVEDNQNERQLLCSVLSLQGFEVSSAGDGIEAVQALCQSSHLPDAVLLDMQMPRQNGEITLRCIRSDFRLQHLKVVGVSGNQPQLQSLPDDLPGFDAWFSKPLEIKRLLDLISHSSLD